jgi:hypothetical protein
MNVFALLIAIDSYPTAPLDGCVNDSMMVEDYLRTTIAPKTLQLVTLRNEQATKNNITEAFLKHLAQAKSDDIVFVHYSGHGAREQADPIFWRIEPDRQNEVMVTFDAINPTTGEFKPLADKELRWLIKQVAKNNPQITIIFDCCHSGGGTRDNLVNVTPRFTQAKGAKVRETKDYIFAQQKYGGNLSQVLDASGFFNLQSGRHLLMAGARSNQTAKELIVGDQVHGIFTYSILEVLKNTSGNVSYSDLMKRASVRVVGTVQDQVPQLETIVPTDANNLFLQGAANVFKKYYTVTKTTTGLWLVDAGAVHGIPSTTVAPTTLLLYNDSTDPETQADQAVMQASTQTVRNAESEIKLLDTPTANSYKATIQFIPIKPTSVQFKTETEGSRIQTRGIEILRQALNTINGPESAGQPSQFIKEVAANQEAEYQVIAYEHQGVEKYRIVKPATDVPLVKQIEGFNPTSARKLIKQLEHISRYDRTFALANANTQLSPQTGLNVEVLLMQDGKEVPANPTDAIINMPYQQTANGLQPAEFKVKISNQSKQTLFCSMLYMAADFSVTNEYLPSAQLEPGEEMFINDGDAMSSEISDVWLNLGVSEERSTLKFIASTDQFDSSLLNLPALEVPVSKRSTTDARNGFEALLLQSNHTRGIKFGKKQNVTDWTTNQITFVATKTLTSQEAQKTALAKVKITPPTGFLAKFGLSSLFSIKKTRSLLGDEANPSIENQPLPPAFADNRPVYFGDPNGTTSDLNVLELSEINNASAVTANSPLTIELPFALDKNEHIIPFATDGELYYPLGYSSNHASGNALVTIQRLPAPTTGERGIGSTIKIVLQKLAGEKLSFPYNYPSLCSATADASGKVSYNNNTIQMATAAQNAAKILLVVHGFSSSTQAILQPANNNTQDSFVAWLAGQYDIILTFDYDTFSTSIKDTASQLEQKLNEIGLNNKKIDVLAHCTGGLVARQWIEQGNGKNLVNKLVMAGTPNNGTPWTRLKDWAIVAATFAANNLTRYGVAPETIAFLSDKARLSANLDRVSGDVRVGAAFLTQLNASPNPNVPYVVIAGNTSMIKHADDKTKSWVQRIFSKTNIATLSQKTLSLFLFGDENDLATSVRSMNAVPVTRRTTTSFEVACDHFSYFNSLQSTTMIKQALVTK